MSIAGHLIELKRKHSALEATIAKNQRSPANDSLATGELKKHKLKLKEKITKLEDSSNLS